MSKSRLCVCLRCLLGGFCVLLEQYGFVPAKKSGDGNVRWVAFVSDVMCTGCLVDGGELTDCSSFQWSGQWTADRTLYPLSQPSQQPARGWVDDQPKQEDQKGGIVVRLTLPVDPTVRRRWCSKGCHCWALRASSATRSTPSLRCRRRTTSL